MNCPQCRGILRSLTEKEINFSLSIHYAQGTHICKKCTRYWIIQEQTIPLNRQSKHKTLEVFL